MRKIQNFLSKVSEKVKGDEAALLEASSSRLALSFFEVALSKVKRGVADRTPSAVSSKSHFVDVLFKLPATGNPTN